MNSQVESFCKLLRQHGHSITPARVGLFSYLQSSGPVLPRQLMADNLGLADRASLYRSLTLLRQLGVIEDRMITGRRLIELTDAYDAHHHHLTCTRCGQSIVLTMPDLEADLARLCEQQDFAISGHVIEASGVCAACQQATTALAKYS